jgi:hypothetical protein
MYIVSWTVNHGLNMLDDYYALFDSREAAESGIASLMEHEDLHCWAVSKVLSASEPHWMEDVA